MSQALTALLSEGWNNSTLAYTHTYPSISSWTTLTLDYDNINRIVIRITSNGNGSLTDYNFDNFTFTSTITSVSGDSSRIPKSYELSQNYPNPFNPSTVINYKLVNPGNVILKVYDMLGKEVATLVNEQQGAGSHSVIFNASNLSSGMYIYVLKTGEFMAKNKMMLVK